MTEATDLNLITYVIRIKPHIKICKRIDLDPNRVYYYAMMREKNDAIVHKGHVIRITTDLALAEIFETGKEATNVGKTLTLTEATYASVHPVSRKIFFEASLKGLR